MDILCRCVNASFFLSHGMRQDVECYLVLLGEPAAPKTLLFKGSELRHLNPDERSTGARIKKALDTICGSEFRGSGEGIYVRKGGLERLLSEHEFAILDENGEDIRDAEDLPISLILSDHENFSEEEERLLSNLRKVSVGPQVLHADHTITVVLNEMDRREDGTT